MSTTAPTPASDKLTISNQLRNILSQSEAGALAVLAGHLKHKIQSEPEIYKATEELRTFLDVLEKDAIDSIAINDGQVAHWIGIAAKQMNPLL